MVTRRALGWALALLVGTAGGIRAQGALPVRVQVPLLLKALSYDRALGRNGTSEVVLAVLYDGASATSTDAKTEFMRAVKESELKSVGARPIRVVELNVAAGQLAARLRERSASVVYLTTGLERRLPEVVEAATVTQVTTMGGSEQYARAGLALAVAAVGDRPKVFVNLPAARLTGADLSVALLRVSTVIQ